MWVDFKQKRKEAFDLMSNRKADEDGARKQQNRELKERMDRS